MPVVGAEREEVRLNVFREDMAYQFLQVSCLAAEPDIDRHAQLELLLEFPALRHLMVRADTRFDVLPESSTTQQRAVPLNDLAQAPRRGEFTHDFRITGDHPREVHYLAQADRTFLGE